LRDPQGTTFSRDLNCEDFKTWEEAQEVFSTCGGPTVGWESSGGIENDAHRLDRDHDGIPCEALR